MNKPTISLYFTFTIIITTQDLKKDIKGELISLREGQSILVLQL